MDKEFYKYTSVIFYKTDEKAGWNVVNLLSNKKKIKEKYFEENKERFGWKEYKVFSNTSTRYFDKEEFEKFKKHINDPEKFTEFDKHAHDVHMLTDWIYRPELDKWFLDEKEEIPIPAADCEMTNELTVETFFEDGYNDLLIDEPWEKPVATLIFKTPQQKHLSRLEMNIYIAMRYNFFKNIKRNKYACYIQYEYTYDKFFAWNCGDKIRFSIQNYDDRYEDNKPKTVFDVLVDKNLLINTLEKQIEIMEREVPRIRKNPATYPFCKEFSDYE